MFIVFDLDGTLADDTHRQHHLAHEKPDWNAYFAECENDPVFEPIAAIARAFMLAKMPNSIEIWTGRSDKFWNETIRWLYKESIPWNRLRMRRDGDYRPDTEVKGLWLAECEDDRPDLIFDDRTKSVAFWRGQGIICCQVAQHDY